MSWLHQTPPVQRRGSISGDSQQRALNAAIVTPAERLSTFMLQAQIWLAHNELTRRSMSSFRASWRGFQASRPGIIAVHPLSGSGSVGSEWDVVGSIQRLRKVLPGPIQGIA